MDRATAPQMAPAADLTITQITTQITIRTITQTTIQIMAMAQVVKTSVKARLQATSTTSPITALTIPYITPVMVKIQT